MIGLFQQGEPVSPAVGGAGLGLLLQQCIEPRPLAVGQAVIDDPAQRPLMMGNRRDDQGGQHGVAGQSDFPARQHLNDVQQNQLGPELDAHHRREFRGRESLGRLIERAAAKVAQDQALVSGIGLLAVGIELNLAGVHPDLPGDELDVRRAELAGEKLAAGLEVSRRHDEAHFIGGSP